MRLESKKKCAVLDGTGLLIVNANFFQLNEFLHESRRDFIASTNSNRVQHKYGGNMCCMSGLRWPCMALINDLIFSEFEIEYWCTPTPSLYQHIHYD